MDKAKLLFNKESDAMRVINGAKAKYQEAKALEKIRTPDAPVKAEAKPAPKNDTEPRNKRISLYCTEKEYETIREYAFRNHLKINEFVIQRVMNHLGAPPKVKVPFAAPTDADVDK